MGFPNIAFVVGSHATLVVDTGLGPKNGATIARVAAELGRNNTKLFLTTTHFHPEHAAGEPGFPSGTILNRDAVQQREMEAHGQEMIDRFSTFSAQNKELLAGVVLRPPDVSFDQEATLELGGVTAHLLWRSPHQRRRANICWAGPHVNFWRCRAEQDHTEYLRWGTPPSWLSVLDKVAALNAEHILPDHSAPGDGSLAVAERELISDIRTRALALKIQGSSADDAGKQVSAALKVQHPAWATTNAAGFVKSVYAESQ
jgi:hypothetical protein